MQLLLNYFNKYASTLISQEDFKIIFPHFIRKTLQKKQFLLQEGEICKHLAFIVHGAMRKYYLDEKGIEHIVDLYIENWWAGDRESFAKSSPSLYTVEAWEDCEILLISRESVLTLRSECPSFNEFTLQLDEKNSIATQKRITASISFSAEKRYADFVERHPYFHQRFPQHMIASYLGMTKDTLSRLRKKNVLKK